MVRDDEGGSGSLALFRLDAEGATWTRVHAFDPVKWGRGVSVLRFPYGEALDPGVYGIATVGTSTPGNVGQALFKSANLGFVQPWLNHMPEGIAHVGMSWTDNHFAAVRMGGYA